MFIQSIQPIKTLEEIQKNTALQSTGSENQIPFKDLFLQAYDSAATTNQALEEEIQKVALGETDDLHNVGIASTKASLALNLVIELRNKGLEAYNEIMRMNI